jgi:hypothetical protein
MSTLAIMADPTPPADDVELPLPGEALESGFRFRPAREAPEARLSAEARRRVIEKMDSVDEARLRAARDGHTAYVG